MTAGIVAQLLINFGPYAIELIQKLAALWSKPTLTSEEVNMICDLAKKSYEDYMKEAP